MKYTFTDRLRRAWNAFSLMDPIRKVDVGPSSSYNGRRVRLSRSNERSIVNAIYTRIAIDVSAIDIKHCQLDKDGRYKEDVDSDLNRCLTLESNIDQNSRAFMRDVVLTMLDSGVAAIVATDCTDDPEKTEAYDVLSMRVGTITEWYPYHVKVNVYDERIGKRREVILQKENVAIVENPFYSVMNENNSTLHRLIKKLNLLDSIDEESLSGKLDLIIQLPYPIKSKARKDMADERRQEIVGQLEGSKYGIAYIDGTEKITQLNRPIENNLLPQIEYLTRMLYGQLGMSEEIINGTAKEEDMLTYQNRTIEPIIETIVLEMRRVFLSKTARTQMQSIMYFKDPFKLVPVGKIAEIADKFTRNEILSSNEIRQKIGVKPSSDPKADQLINSNLNQSNLQEQNLLDSSIYDENQNGEEGE